MRVCDICKKELTGRNMVTVKIEEYKIGELNEHYTVKSNYEICKECKDKAMLEIQEG